MRSRAMIVAGALVTVLSLVLVGVALTTIRGDSQSARAADGETPPRMSSSVPVLGIVGGVGLAIGGALIGVGMGRWGRPRLAKDDGEFTGPGTVDRSGGPPRVV